MNVDTTNFFQNDKDKNPDTPQPNAVKSCFGQSNESRKNSLMTPAIAIENQAPHFGQSNSSQNSQGNSSAK